MPGPMSGQAVDRKGNRLSPKARGIVLMQESKDGGQVNGKSPYQTGKTRRLIRAR